MPVLEKNLNSSLRFAGAEGTSLLNLLRVRRGINTIAALELSQAITTLTGNEPTTAVLTAQTMLVRSE